MQRFYNLKASNKQANRQTFNFIYVDVLTKNKIAVNTLAMLLFLFQLNLVH